MAHLLVFHNPCRRPGYVLGSGLPPVSTLAFVNFVCVWGYEPVDWGSLGVLLSNISNFGYLGSQPVDGCKLSTSFTPK